MSEPDFESIAKQAVGCRICFRELVVEPALIDIAQPRCVGPEYWSAKPRVLMILLNPGSGEFRKSSADVRALELLRKFRDGTGSLEAVLEHQSQDMRISDHREHPFRFNVNSHFARS